MKHCNLLALSILAIMSAGGAEAAGPRGGTMVFALSSDPLILDPALSEAQADISVLTNVYETLIIPSKDGKSLTSGLASEWSWAADGLTLTVKLRPDITFSDGAPITAADVVWSLNRVRNAEAGPFRSLLASIDGVTATGSATVAVHLKNPDPSLPAALATFNAAIMPEKPFEATPGATDDEKAKAFAQHPVGSGPFTLAGWVHGSAITLKRNPHYWAHGEDGQPLPYLDAVEFRVIPKDDARITSLRAGQIDGAENIPFSRVKELHDDPSLNTMLYPSTVVKFIIFNARPKLADGTPNPLSDERVRQALNYAVDKPALTRDVTEGLGAPSRSFMSSATPLFSDQGPPYPFDPAKAKALLAEAGYGSGLNLTCMVNANNADNMAIAAAMQRMWADAGVKLTMEPLGDHDALMERYDGGKFQTMPGFWSDDINDPNEATSYVAYFPNIESQHSGWQSKNLDALFEKSQKEIDPQKRAELYAQIQKIYLAAAPIAFLYEAPWAVALSKRVDGFFQTPLSVYTFKTATVAR